jgi:raffinose/stachyose/melibiose transport system substrate-binding protein
MGFAINARSPRRAAAERFIAFLARPENARKFNAESFNVPLDPSSTQGMPAFLTSFIPFYLAGRTVPFMDQRWPNADTQQEHIAVAQDLLAGRVTVDEGLRRMDRAFALR